jgi:RNA polymerase sigma-70 factor (ECF subfamily)
MSDLDAAVDAARAEWPKLKVNRAEFRTLLSSSGPKALSHASDLYLAFACTCRDPAAARELAARVDQEVPHALRHFGQDTAFAEDVGQQLLTKLLAGGKGDRRKIESYAGRGPLNAWLRAAAVRTAINALETQKSQASVDANLAVPGRGPVDPELAHIRKKYGAALKGVVEAALRDLQPDDRNVLRFYFVDGLTVEQIARLRGAHKSTVSRLITRVRTQLLADVKEQLADRLKARPEELSSVLRAMVSQLDVSIERALR